LTPQVPYLSLTEKTSVRFGIQLFTVYHIGTEHPSPSFRPYLVLVVMKIGVTDDDLPKGEKASTTEEKAIDNHYHSPTVVTISIIPTLGSNLY
jgi:hypothetical protein